MVNSFLGRTIFLINTYRHYVCIGKDGAGLKRSPAMKTLLKTQSSKIDSYEPLNIKENVRSQEDNVSNKPRQLTSDNLFWTVPIC